MPDLKLNGVVAKQPQHKANLLNQFFRSVFVKDDNTALPIVNIRPTDKTNIEITTEGLLKLLRDIKTSKSCGPDKISGILLKTFAHIIAHTLTLIFKYSLSTHTLPDIWKCANIKPIYKKGDRSLPNNYRPVSLTCITCKLLEHIIASHMNTVLEQNDILTDCQHGFRRNRSCETQLVHAFNDLAFNHERGVKTDVIILDFTKAFDSVNHRKLIFKLQSYGINIQVLNWVKAFLVDRKQIVMVDDKHSDTCEILSGVPQGSVLGPLLFLLYINDLPEQITSQCRLFADDALLYNTRENTSVLQDDLNKLESWSHTWQLSFNSSKCSVLSVGEKDSQQAYFLNNARLQNVNSHPYLGIEFSCNLKWNLHLDILASKATRTLGMLQRVLKTADTKTRLVAYNTLVKPILEYGCQVWDPYLKKDIKKLEKIQNKALRFVFKIKHQISFSKLRKDTGILSLAKRRKRKRIKLYCQVIESGVIQDRYQSAPERFHQTRQREGLFLPSIRTNAYYHSFWPRTTRNLRDDSSDSEG